MDEQIACLAELREWAGDPRSVMSLVLGKTGCFVIFPEDVDGKSDEELLALVRGQRSETA